MTKEVMERTIKKLAKNYEQLEDSLVSQLQLETPNHSYTIGAYRERVWQSLFEMIIPKKYQIEQSVFIIDSYGNISKEVDLAVFDETYTPYIFNFGEIKFIPIEAVAVVVQCKSKIANESDKGTVPQPQDEVGKHRETMSENLKKWVESIADLKISLDSVTRTITDLVDNSAGELLGAKNLTQTSTRPIRILCATQIAEPMRAQLAEKFDILLYIEEETEQDGKATRLTKVIAEEERDFVEWNDELNHWGYDRYEKEGKSYREGRRNESLKSKASLKSRKLSQLRVTDKQGDENTILSLTFQLNQLLMIINNPPLFPHRAYANMFTRMLDGEIAKGD